MEYKIPKGLTNKLLMDFINEGRCRVNSAHDCAGGLASNCQGCLLQTIGVTRNEIDRKLILAVEYGVNIGWITKVDALRITLDSKFI